VTRQVVVIGGGISGLAAAWELTGGVDGPGPSTPQVTVLESSDRLGGALRSGTFGGRVIDLGPDGFLGRRPEATELCHEVGLADALAPIGGRGAGVWARGQVRTLPEGLALGIPTRFWPTARSGLLGLRGTLGLARDALAPRPDVRGPIGDRAIGPLVARKLGQRVVDTLADPLIGGIHAGSVDDMSAAATYPPLLAAAQRRGGLMRALRAEVPPPAENPAPLFWSLDGGLQLLPIRLAEQLANRGVTIRTVSAATALSRVGSGWTVTTGQDDIPADGVILAVSGPVAAALVRPHDDEMAGLLAGIDYASVSLVTFRFPEAALSGPLVGTGFLVPRRGRRPGTTEGWAVTACTYLSAKWPHLARPDEVLLRTSFGRFGDDRPGQWSDAELVTRGLEELTELMGIEGAPLESLVTRFEGAFPQYRLHHLLRTSGIEAAATRIGGLAVAGAAYRGVGIPACIASGRSAARSLR
jgi:oxygen-dependent protoporphyrinogen oxidase